MFTSKETADILGISKSTLLRYLKEKPDLEPSRKITGKISERDFFLEDLYKLTQYNHEKGAFQRQLCNIPDEGVDIGKLERKIFEYSIKIAKANPNRSQEIFDNISPIIKNNGELQRLLYNSCINEVK
jgi:predicted transcriptional regulator